MTRKSLLHRLLLLYVFAWGEALGLSREEATVGKIMDALKKMGIDYVFDTSFTADLTIMEEGNEFLQRFTKGELNLRPMFTSCFALDGYASLNHSTHIWCHSFQQPNHHSRCSVLL